MHNNKYKYWFFYIKPEYLSLVYTESEDSLLYAYTDNKEYAEIFKNQRDMNKFFVKKREIEKDEVNYLASEFTREYLIKKDIKTKVRGIGSENIDYTLILTKTEDYMIQSTTHKVLMADVWVCTWLNPYIFNKKYINALNNIGFIDRYNLTTDDDSGTSKVNKMGKNIQPDYLSAFIRHYGFLLSLKKGD
jgi:hypothetical protein